LLALSYALYWVALGATQCRALAGDGCPELTGCAGGDAAAVVDLVVDEPEALL